MPISLQSIKLSATVLNGGGGSLELLSSNSNSFLQYIYLSTTASIYSSDGGIGTLLVAGVFARATTSSLDWK